MKILILILLIVSPLLAQEAKVIEKMPDGYIVSIDGKEYRAFTPDKVLEISIWKKESEGFRELSKTMNTYLTQREAFWKLSLEKEEKNTSFWKGEYEKEKALRISFGKQLKKCTPKFIGVRLCTF